MLINPSQQHPGLKHSVLQLQEEATRTQARFKPALPKKSGVDGGAIRCQHILVSRFTCTPHGDLVKLFLAGSYVDTGTFYLKAISSFQWPLLSGKNTI